MDEHLFNEINRIMPHGSITMEDFKNMQTIKKTNTYDGYDIYAIQHKDLTILVRISENRVVTIHIISW